MKKNLLIVLCLFSIFSYSQTRVTDLVPNSQSGGLDQSHELAVLNNKLIFKAIVPNQFTHELFAYGSSAFPLKNLAPVGLGKPSRFVYSNNLNTMFFNANDAPTQDNFELWKTDGTTAGTVLVKDINTNGNGDPANFTDFNNLVYFNTRYDSGYRHLSFTDGTSAGTDIVTNVVYNPQNLTVLNNELFFSGSTLTGDIELWKSDGTSSGTVLVKNINASSTSNPEQLTVYNNLLYFVADNGINGKELWVSDGTTSGTNIVSDYNPGTSGSNPTDLTIYKGRLYLSAITPTHGRELHRVNSSGNLSLFRDINIGSTGSNVEKIFHYTSTNILLFVAGNGNNNKELYYTNGSIIGTNRVKDINPGNGSSDINIYNTYFKEYNGKVYFTANDGIYGNEVWVTDGTESGTIMLRNIDGGSFHSPRNFAVVNNKLYFIHNDANGYEIFEYIDPLLSTNELSKTIFKLFPNPTSISFSISNNIDVTDILIYDVQGKLTKQFDTRNNEYNIEDLSSGLYFIKIKTNNREDILKLIKD